MALHAEQTIACLKAGKHVLCEKPTAMNFAQAETMVAAAKESGRLLGVSYFRRLFPKLIRAKELIAEGAMGQPVLAEANCHSGWRVRSGGGCGIRRWRVEGRCMTLGSHRIDAMNFLFGQAGAGDGVAVECGACDGGGGFGYGVDGVCGWGAWGGGCAVELAGGDGTSSG